MEHAAADRVVQVYEARTGDWVEAVGATLEPGDTYLDDGRVLRVGDDGVEVRGEADAGGLADADATWVADASHRIPSADDWVLVLGEADEAGHWRLADVVPGERFAFQGRVFDTADSDADGHLEVRWSGDVLGEVVDTFVRVAPEVIDAEVAYADGTTDTLTGTPNHPFWVDAVRDYVPLGELEVGTVLHVQGGGEAILVSKTWRQGDFEVFDFEVEGLHNFYVRGPGSDAAGVLVHNSDALYSRGSWRKSTLADAEGASRAANDGNLLCATCGKDVSGKVTVETKRGPVERRGYDLDHYPDTWAERVDELKSRPEAPSRKEVLDEYNRDVRVQCPECNQGHQYEGVAGDYQ